MVLKIACTFDLEGLAAFEAAGERIRGTDFLVLPELVDGGYARLHRDGGPRKDVAELSQRFAQTSRKLDLNLIAGTMALPDPSGVVSNTCLVFSCGLIAGQFSKAHMYRPLGDDRFFTPDRPGHPVELDCHGQAVRVAVIVCYDLRFPEAVRPSFKSGLDILFVPARWPRVRDEAWRALLQARAIENQCFTVGVDSRDDEGGGSYAYGPDGAESFALGPNPTSGEPPWHMFEIDLDDIRRTKDRLDTRADAWLL